jgi:excisionase family DNA binding protein
VSERPQPQKLGIRRSKQHKYVSACSNEEIIKQLKELNKKMNIFLVLLLANQELTLKEVADILGVSERTIQRVISIRKIRAGKVKMKKRLETIEEEQESGEK